jgi:ribosome modulation factor
MSSSQSPSRFRREGRNAFYPGGVAEDTCRYNADAMKRSNWLAGWAEAESAHQQELERPPSLAERVTRLEEIVGMLGGKL